MRLLQSKLIPVFIVAAIVQMALLAGAIFTAQKVEEAGRALQRSQEIQFRAASMEREVLSANMSGSNFVKDLGGEGAVPATQTVAADQAYKKGIEELDNLEALCGTEEYYKENIAKLRKILEITQKLADRVRAEMTAGKAEGVTGMLKVIPAVQLLYKTVDKMNVRINEMLVREQSRAQQLVQQRDQSQQMLTLLLFSGLLITLGDVAMIPLLMKRS